MFVLKIAKWRISVDFFFLGGWNLGSKKSACPFLILPPQILHASQLCSLSSFSLQQGKKRPLAYST